MYCDVEVVGSQILAYLSYGEYVSWNYSSLLTMNVHGCWYHRKTTHMFTSAHAKGNHRWESWCWNEWLLDRQTFRLEHCGDGTENVSAIIFAENALHQLICMPLTVSFWNPTKQIQTKFFRNKWNSKCECLRCLALVVLYTKISSKRKTTQCPKYGQRTLSIRVILFLAHDSLVHCFGTSCASEALNW